MFINELGNEEANQATNTVLKYIAENSSLGISIHLDKIHGNRSEPKLFLKNSMLIWKLELKFLKKIFFLKTFPNLLRFVLLCSVCHVLKLSWRWSTSAYSFWCNENASIIWNCKILYFGSCFTNGQCIVWSGQWFSTMA